jgi:hypothetical protein
MHFRVGIERIFYVFRRKTRKSPGDVVADSWWGQSNRELLRKHKLAIVQLVRAISLVVEERRSLSVYTIKKFPLKLKKGD